MLVCFFRNAESVFRTIGPGFRGQTGRLRALGRLAMHWRRPTGSHLCARPPAFRAHCGTAGVDEVGRGRRDNVAELHRGFRIEVREYKTRVALWPHSRTLRHEAQRVRGFHLFPPPSRGPRSNLTIPLPRGPWPCIRWQSGRLARLRNACPQVQLPRPGAPRAPPTPRPCISGGISRPTQCSPL